MVGCDHLRKVFSKASERLRRGDVGSESAVNQ